MIAFQKRLHLRHQGVEVFHVILIPAPALPAATRLLFGLLMLLQKGKSPFFSDGFNPKADRASVFSEALGDSRFR